MVLGISIAAHSSGALIATGSSGYIAGSMGVLAAAGPLGWVGLVRFDRCGINNILGQDRYCHVRGVIR